MTKLPFTLIETKVQHLKDYVSNSKPRSRLCLQPLQRLSTGHKGSFYLIENLPGRTILPSLFTSGFASEPEK